MSGRPWRLEFRALPGHDLLRDVRWGSLRTFTTPERARRFLAFERTYHLGRYEYRLFNRDTHEVVAVDDD